MTTKTERDALRKARDIATRLHDQAKEAGDVDGQKVYRAAGRANAKALIHALDRMDQDTATTKKGK